MASRRFRRCLYTRLAADAAAAIAHSRDLQGDDRLVLAAALTHDFGKATHTQVHYDGRITSFGHAEAGVAPAKEFLDAIGCPSRISDQVLPMVREHMCATTSGPPTKSAVRRLERRLGDAPIEMWAMVVEAHHQGRASASSSGPAGAWVDLARDISVLDQPVSAVVTGRDLIAAGLPPGPAFKSILAAAIAAQDDGIIGDHESGIRWLQSHLYRRIRIFLAHPPEARRRGA